MLTWEINITNNITHFFGQFIPYSILIFDSKGLLWLPWILLQCVLICHRKMRGKGQKNAVVLLWTVFMVLVEWKVLDKIFSCTFGIFWLYFSIFINNWRWGFLFFCHYLKHSTLAVRLHLLLTSLRLHCRIMVDKTKILETKFQFLTEDLNLKNYLISLRTLKWFLKWCCLG